jgi:hypothetical protein
MSIGGNRGFPNLAAGLHFLQSSGINLRVTYTVSKVHKF